MTKYPCGRCKREEDMPTHQWIMFGRLDDNGELPKYFEGGKCPTTRMNLDDNCAEKYLTGITRIRNSQNGNRPDPISGTAVVKDGWHPGEVYTLTDGNYENLRKWAFAGRNERTKPLEPERRTSL